MLQNLIFISIVYKQIHLEFIGEMIICVGGAAPQISSSTIIQLQLEDLKHSRILEDRG